MKLEWTDHFHYQLIGKAVEICKEMLNINSEIIFKEPVDYFDGYVVYSISNYNGTIIVDTILNSEMKRSAEEFREPRHENTTKGTESLNFIVAVDLLAREVVEFIEVEHPEWEGKKLNLILG